MSAILEVDKVSVSIGGTELLHEVDLELQEGEIVALLGSNGSGKTTLLNSLARFVPPTKGQVRWLGQVCRGAPDGLAKKGLIMVPERGAFSQLSVQSNLRLGRGGIARALELFPELEPLLKRRAGLLSGGEQQILVMARALSSNPKALLVDELSMGLAPLVVNRLLGALKAAAERGIGVIMVEQQAPRALRFADRAYVLQRGKVVIEGAAPDLLADFDNLRVVHLALAGNRSPVVDDALNTFPPLSASEPPLAGLRVVEFGQLIAAPLAGMILADLGADVIKVEAPGGDPGRTLKSSHFTGKSASPTFAAYNRNKRSIVLDLKDPEGVTAAHRLVESADVVIQNFRPGVMERFGLGYEQTSAVNPALVYASLTGFGFTGPDRDRPAVDLIIQAESGIMEITGFSDGPPTKVGFTLVDAASGNVLAQAILAALLRRMRTGLGDHVTISLLDVALHLQSAELGEYLASGTLPPRVGNSAPTTAPADLMRTSDGYIVISAYFRQHWDILCDAVHLPELIHDPRFATMEARIAHRGELMSALETALSTNTTEYWAELLQGLGLVIGRARTYADVATSEQVAANGILIDIVASEGEAARAVRLPYRLASEGPRTPVRAPFLGEHTDEVLAELGAGISAGEPRDP